MELEARLRAFAAVAREGSFSHAAETLYVSQPAVSKHVAALEAEVGKQLLVRDRRGATLTPAGQVLADYVLRAEALLANAHRAIGEGADAHIGTLAFAASGIPGTYLLPTPLARFAELHPTVDVDFRLTTSAAALELVRAHGVELAVVGGFATPQELESEPLVDDEIVLVGPPELGNRRLRPTDIEELTWVMREEGSATRAAVESARSQLGLGKVRTLELPTWEAVKLAVAGGAGIAPISRFALDVDLACGALVVLDVPRWRLRRTISVVRARGVPLTPPAERFLALLRERFSSDEKRLPPNSNLSLPDTTLLGRDVELAQLTSMLEHEPARLVTLTGVPGAGKTRLAIEAAARIVNAFPGGVLFVDLAPVVDSDLVLSTIASTLAVEGPEALRERLSGDRTLLVLDNVEQVAGAARDVADLVRAPSTAKILVTSRTALRVRGERLREVPPLAAEEAVALFLDRARNADPAFTPDGSEPALCERLDRLPLALEIVAARAGELTPAALLDGLHGAISTLASRDEPDRHRTLTAAIAWSYDLLDPRAQQVFRQLSVFSGGFTAGAAEAVCGADADTIAQLVEQHLVTRAGAAGRFRMLETIRAFADDRLIELDEAADVRRRHADYVLSFAQEARVGLDHGDRASWLPAVEQELANVRSALRWAAGDDNLEYRIRLVSALGQFWVARGPANEMLEILRTGLDQVDSRELRAEALRPLSWLLAWIGDLEGARVAAEERRALAKQMGDVGAVVGALGTLADVAEQEGDIQQAQAMYEEAVELGRTGGAIHTLNNLGGFYGRRGDFARARAAFEELLEAARERGDAYLEAHALGDLAGVDVDEGRFAEALPLLEENLLAWRDFGDLRCLASSLSDIAIASAGVGEPERAATIAETAEAVARRVGIPLERRMGDLFDREVATLDRVARERAQQRGMAMTVDEAVAFATQRPA